MSSLGSNAHINRNHMEEHLLDPLAKLFERIPFCRGDPVGNAHFFDCKRCEKEALVAERQADHVFSIGDMHRQAAVEALIGFLAGHVDVGKLVVDTCIALLRLYDGKSMQLVCQTCYDAKNELDHQAMKGTQDIANMLLIGHMVAETCPNEFQQLVTGEVSLSSVITTPIHVAAAGAPMQHVASGAAHAVSSSRSKKKVKMAVKPVDEMTVKQVLDAMAQEADKVFEYGIESYRSKCLV